MHAVFALGQFAGKVPHGREKQHGALPMAGRLPRRVGDFHHEDRVALLVEVGKRRSVEIELICEDNCQAIDGAAHALLFECHVATHLCTRINRMMAMALRAVHASVRTQLPATRRRAAAGS
jgi:hypothetical protein